jgi:glycerol-3-phosphate dehydrogenase (NAD(P)+)
MSTTPRVAVLGAGSWGTALANLLAKKGMETCVWSYDPAVADTIEREHRNPKYLSEVPLDPRLRATAAIAAAVEGAATIVSVSPSQVVRTVIKQAAPHIAPGTLIVSASKGIELGSLKLMDEVLAEALGGDAAGQLAFLSGPSFALEVGQEQPTAVTMAAHDADAAARAQELFQTPYFRVYTHDDVRGVELGGALKNVVAIAAGAVDGLGLGHNTLAALITRGLAEITRLGIALGAHPQTFAGLAGMGDLILTCTGGLSRNRSVGYELGRGRTLDDVLGGMTMVAEGVKTAESAWALAQQTGVEMPIVETVNSLLTGRMTAREAVGALMHREPKPEHWT